MPIGDLFGLLRQKKQTSPDKYLASSVNIVSTGEKGQLRPPFSQQRGISSFHSWVYAAATINANAVASVPLRLYKKADKRTRQKTRQVPLRTKAYLLGDSPGDQRPSMSVLRKVAEFGDEVEEVTGSDPILDLLSTANPFLNGFDLTVLRILYGELTGNAYLHPIIDDDTDLPSELWPLAPNYVEVIPCEEDFVQGYVYGIDSSKKQTFEPDEVIHFRRPNPGNYFYGMGKVEAAFGAVLSNDAVHQMDLSTFANSARPDYAVVVKGTPTGDQLDRFQSQVEERLKGTRKDGNFIAVSGDVQFTPLNFPPKDVAGREDIVEEIAAIFGVPVSMLKANDPNLASAKMGFSQWREGTILPLCRMDEQELNQSLLPMFGAEDDYFLAYDNPVPKDESFDLQQRQTAVAGGWRTPNEARQEEGREPIEDPMADSLLHAGQPLGGMGAGGILPPLGGGLPGSEAAPVEDAGEAAPEQPEAEGTPSEGEAAAPIPTDPTANLNGAQIQSVIAILDGVAAGTIAQTAAVELIMATGVTRESAQRMVGDQDEAKPEAQAEAEIEQAIEPMTEEQKSAVNMATVADVSMALRSGYLTKWEATKTLQAAGMTRKHAERLVKLEAKKANVLRTEGDLYATKEEAERIAEMLGCEGHHTHDVNGRTMYMPCGEMADYTELTGEEHESDEDLDLVDAKAVADIDLKPTETMSGLAERGLKLREEHGRGGTEIGVARARDIKNRDNLSPETVGRMVNFFSRHRVDLDAPAAKPGHDEYPSAGVIAWLLWGGDPADPDGGGHAWAKEKLSLIESERDGQKGGGVSDLIPKIWGTRLSANARTALGRLILEKADDCGTGAGGFKPGNDCAEGHGRPRSSKDKPSQEMIDAALERSRGRTLESSEYTQEIPDFEEDRISLVGDGTDDLQVTVADSITGTSGLRESGPHEFFFYDYDDQPAGHARAVKRGDTITFSMIALEEDYQGQGLGTDLYKYFLDDLGLDIKSDKEQSPAAQALYRKLIDQGYPPKIDDDGLLVLQPKDKPKTREEQIAEFRRERELGPRFDPATHGKDKPVENMQDAVAKIRAQPENVMDGWFRNGDENYKPRIVRSLAKDPELLSASHHVMYEQAKANALTDLPKREYLEKPVELYRGGKLGTPGFDSYTFDRSVAEKFSSQSGEPVSTITIKPEETYGMMTTTGEQEVLVPSEVSLVASGAVEKSFVVAKDDNCGTGAGGFQQGNDCAVGHGRPTTGERDKKRGVTQEDRAHLDKVKQDLWLNTSGEDKQKAIKILAKLDPEDQVQELKAMRGGSITSGVPTGLTDSQSQESLKRQRELVGERARSKDSYLTGQDAVSPDHGLARDYVGDLRDVAEATVSENSGPGEKYFGLSPYEKDNRVDSMAHRMAVLSLDIDNQEVQAFGDLVGSAESRKDDFSQERVDQFINLFETDVTDADDPVSRMQALQRLEWSVMDERKQSAIATAYEQAERDYSKMKDMTPAEIDTFARSKALSIETHFAERGVSVRVDPTTLMSDRLNMARDPDWEGLYDLDGVDRGSTFEISSGYREAIELDQAISKMQADGYDLSGVNYSLVKKRSEYQSFGTVMSEIELPKAALAHYNPNNGQVVMHVEARGIQKSSGYAVGAGSNYANAIHETMHALHDQAMSERENMSASTFKRMGEFIGDKIGLKDAAGLRDDAKMQIGAQVWEKMKKAVPRSVSQYAATEPSEFVAEAGTMRVLYKDDWSKQKNKTAVQLDKLFMEQVAEISYESGSDGYANEVQSGFSASMADMYEMMGGQ